MLSLIFVPIILGLVLFIDKTEKGISNERDIKHG